VPGRCPTTYYRLLHEPVGDFVNHCGWRICGRVRRKTGNPECPK
jgi:hypothetical protein